MELETLNLRKAGDLGYTTLREAIIGGKLESGYRLYQDELARLLSVNRGPVRDALQKLESEGTG